MYAVQNDTEIKFDTVL